MSLQAVIFDLDGTLLDTLTDIAASVNTVLAENGYPELPVEVYRKMIGHGVFDLISRVVPDHARTEEHLLELHDSLTRVYSASWDENTLVYPGVMSALNELLERDIKLAVLSNKPEKLVKAAVGSYFPGHMFEVVIGGGERYPLKPSPRAALSIADYFRVRPSECMLVGDSEVDIQTAQDAEMISAGVLWGFRDEDDLRQAGADLIVADPAEIIACLDDF